MKLIIVGANGFVGSEVLRLALLSPAIESIFALVRRSPGPNANTDSRVRWIVLGDWSSPFKDHIAMNFQKANACIWAAGPSPAKAGKMNESELKAEYSVLPFNGLKNMAKVCKKPFRFVYASTNNVEVSTPRAMDRPHPYNEIRYQSDSKVSKFGNDNPDTTTIIALVNGVHAPRGPYQRDAYDASADKEIPTLHVSEYAIALLNQAVKDIASPILGTQDLAKLAAEDLKPEMYLQ